jgi:hypothetical protein
MVETSGHVLYFADSDNNRIRTITLDSPDGLINTVASKSLTPSFGGAGGAPANGGECQRPGCDQPVPSPARPSAERR